MTNLADLLPAGGGQNNTDFVADGNISAGVPVVLTAAGKAAAITGSGGSVGTSAVFESATSNHMAATYDSTNNKVVICYRDDGNSYYGTAVVATVSGNSISFGTPAVFSSSSTQRIAPVFDTYRNRVVIIYKNDGDGSKPYGISGAVSGTSISFATAGLIAGISCDSVSACFDSVNNQTIFSYARSASDGQTGTASVDVSGGIGFGSTYSFLSGGAPSYTQTVFDPDTSKAVVFFTDSADSYKGKARVITNSSGTISFGTVATMDSSAFFLNTGVDYDTSANKMVIAFADQNTSNYGFALVGTVSGTDITFGTITQFIAGNMSAGSGEGVPVIYDSSLNKSIVAFKNATDGDIGQFTELTVSGTSVTGGSATTFQSGSGVTYVSGAYDTNANKTVLAYTNAANSSYGTGVVITPNTSTLTSTNLLGLAPSAISNTATGTINTWGSRCENSSFLGSALSAGSLVAFETGGSPSALSGVAFDANAGKMVIAYTYGLNGYAIVGTVSGTSASYGTAVIFQASAAVYSVNAAYDANAQKVVIIYTDGSNSDYPTAIVGTVSGTSISFGTKVAFLSSGAAGDPMSIAYDANAQKVVIGFRDTSNSNYGTGIVGTVSGTSISFGTKTAFNSSATLEFTTVYDSDAQKVAIGYRDAGNSSYGTAVVGTVSGTSISFGSPQVFLSAQTDNMGGCFDSTNNKVVFCYRDTGNSNYGTAIVGTISGTSISFGSSAVYNNGGSTSYNNASYDAGAGKVIISYAQGNAATIAGTVSGTSISFDTAVVLDAGGGMGEVGQAYDSTNAKTLIAFQSAGNSYHGYSATVTYGDLPLTVTSDYYVQLDGSLSTDTGGQLIGKAITATQINIKDYTG
jgi:hypothetical protein